ncbi:hypothetical protein Q7565_19385 (plasmid) [Acinetobacter baumannii]|jgi:hypothetical protein|uniref:hypothetical protein n=1 Tax=Psychrobacter sp. TaxID=56811 RepID=UPI0028AFE661|nr:hypothetical protein [Psychrobacter sp.]
MTTQSDIKKLAEQMAGSMNSFDDIKLKKITDLKSVIFEWTIARISVLNSFYK